MIGESVGSPWTQRSRHDTRLVRFALCDIYAVTERSTTPLATKLGIDEGSKVTMLHAPNHLALGLPANVTVRRQPKGASDVVVAFFTTASELERQIETLGKLIFPAGGLWVAWPKKSSGVDTDLTGHAVRSVALARGLVDNKVCAIDETWTALRLVWRRAAR